MGFSGVLSRTNKKIMVLKQAQVLTVDIIIDDEHDCHVRKCGHEQLFMFWWWKWVGVGTVSGGEVGHIYHHGVGRVGRV